MVEVIVRKRGKSLWITFPKRFVEEQNIREGDIITIPIIERKNKL